MKEAGASSTIEGLINDCTSGYKSYAHLLWTAQSALPGGNLHITIGNAKEVSS